MDKVSTYSQPIKKAIFMQHDEQAQCFRIEQDGEIALLEYVFLDDPANLKQVIDFKSTFVPPALRGKGIAEQLVRAGLSWAKAQDYQITATCWYVEKFLKKR
ncbi:MAG: GNAT family N-acetyltransferase [Marinomonas sp.]|uniref:GNAT family N-acetyltransferase n=1 Tax=unclassified Marinomonas TaxID=196814 RepID=UPI000B2C0E4D